MPSLKTSEMHVGGKGVYSLIRDTHKEPGRPNVTEIKAGIILDNSYQPSKKAALHCETNKNTFSTSQYQRVRTRTSVSAPEDLIEPRQSLKQSLLLPMPNAILMHINATL